METMMPRDVRYMCKQHGPFLVTIPAGPSYRTPIRVVCPTCGFDSPRAHRQRRGTKSISVRAETRGLLLAESKRRGVPMRQLVEEYTRDIK